MTVLIALLWLATALALPRAEAVPAVGEPRSQDGVHVVAGGWRAEIHDGEVRWAESALLGSIVAYTRSGRRWLFVDSLGVVATSRRFLGPLRRGEQLPSRPASASAGAGVLVVQGLDGRWWISEAGALRPLQHPAGAVLSAAFVDPARGGVMTEGGTLWRTTDGGEHWAPQPMEAPPLRLELRPDLVAISWGAREEPLVAASAPVVGLSEADRALLKPGLQLRALAQADPVGSVRTADGKVWWLEHRDEFKVFVGRLGETEGLALPTTSCTRLEAWGDRPVAVCPASTSVFVGRAGWQSAYWTPLGGDSYFFPRTIRFDTSGRYAVYYGPCKDSPMSRYWQSHLCFTADGGETWRELYTKGDYIEILELDASRALVHQTCSMPCVSGLVVVDLETGKERPVIVPEALQQDHALLQAHVFGDTVVAVFGHHEDPDAPSGRPVASTPSPPSFWPYIHGARPDQPASPWANQLTLGVGPPEALALRPLPEGALFADLLNPKLGFAAGDDGGELWSTQDGGLSWAPLQLEVDGPPAAVPLARYRADAEVALRCRGERCLLADRDTDDRDFDATEPGQLPRRVPVTLLLHTGSDEGTKVLAPQAPVAPRPTWETGYAMGLPPLACVVGEPGASKLPPVAPGVLRGSVNHGGVEVAVDVVPDGEDGLATVRWIDERGAHASRPIRVDGAWLADTRPSFAVFGVTPRGVLLLGAGARTSPSETRSARARSPYWWWVLDGEEPALTRGERGQEPGMAAEDGAGGLWATEHDGTWSWPEPTQTRAVRALHFAASGEVTPVDLRVGLVTSPFTPVAGYADGPVLARPAGTSALPVETLSLESGELRTIGRAGPLDVCSGAPQGAALRVPFLWNDQGPVAWALLDVGPEASCVRGVDGRAPDPRSPTRALRVSLRAEQGRLAGSDDQGLPLRCEAATR